MTWDFIDKENFNRRHTKIRYNLYFIEQLTTQKEVDKQIGKRVRKMSMLLHKYFLHIVSRNLTSLKIFGTNLEICQGLAGGSDSEHLIKKFSQ